MILEGYVTDKNAQPIANAIIEVKAEIFVTLFCTVSDENGYYRFDIPAAEYPFLTAVKEYGVNYLEYWCQNIPLYKDISLNIVFDKLEIYGLHVFSVKGAGNNLMAYFRPMSLPKFQQGDQDIAPANIAIQVMVDGQEVPVVLVNTVKERAADRDMTAYLIQVEPVSMQWHRFDLQIIDQEGNLGAAAIFNDKM